ncbi:YidH family protein [Variovorax sp. GB1R11]|uniref:YidH family protein n=1 Tax=Variovorax sp. GB1R11 TaxID=3443741 RepID=UPI003F46F26E
MTKDKNWEAPRERFDVKPSVETHFSWLRTRMSVERTLMSWVRTSTALIGFGFTIVQFFAGLQKGEGPSQLRFPEASGYFGLGLIVAGVVALAISARQYRSMLHYLWSEDFTPVAGLVDNQIKTPLLGVAIVLAVIGAFAAVSVIINLF